MMIIVFQNANTYQQLSRTACNPSDSDLNLEVWTQTCLVLRAGAQCSPLTLFATQNTFILGFRRLEVI